MEEKNIINLILLNIIYENPSINIEKTIFLLIDKYKNKEIKDLNQVILKLLPNNIYGIDIKRKLNNRDLLSYFLDELYNNLSNKIETNYNEEYAKYMQRYYFVTKGKKIVDLNIYENSKIIEFILKDIDKVLDLYLSELNIDDIFKFKEQISTNVKNLEIESIFYDNLLNNNIQIESQRGYKSSISYPQQDAVLSIVKNPHCYLNAIADGAGGSINGQKASSEIIKRLKIWFISLPDYLLKDNNIIFLQELINRELIKVNNYLAIKYPNSYSTVVLTLTINNYTIIANVGDSTAYIYEDNDLISLTTLDSLSRGMSYEEARKSPYNNTITASIGNNVRDFEDSFIHFMIIKNNGQKLILSSDGVTDLISEERFKSYFKKETSAYQIVSDAVNIPDVNGIKKKEDNVSAIVIKLPKENIKNKTLLNKKRI